MKKLHLLVIGIVAVALVGCGSSDPTPSVGEVVTSPKGQADMAKDGAKPAGGKAPDINN